MNTNLLLNEEATELTPTPTAKVTDQKPILQMPKSVEKYAETVRELYRQESHDSPFKLGDALNIMADKMEKAFKGKKATNNMIAAFLDVDLTVQRISSLRKTAAWFPFDCRKSEYSFRTYEQYRKNEQKKVAKDQRMGEQLVAAMDAKEMPSNKNPPVNSNKHTLTIRVTVDTTDPENLKFDPQFSADGKALGEIEAWMIAAAEQAKVAIDGKFKNA